MKIGIFASSLGSAPSLTGVNTYSLALVESLYKYDNQNEYIIFLSEANQKFYEHIKENNRWKKVILKPLLVEDFSIFKKIYRVLPMFLPFTEYLNFDYEKTGFVSIPIEIIKELNFIHYTVFNSCSSIPFFMNKSFIVTMHDLRLFYPEFSKKLNETLFFTHIIMKRIFINVAKKSSAIICETKYVKQDIKKFIRIKNKKIYVVTSPLIDKFENEAFDFSLINSIKEKYNIPDKFLFYPSPLTEDKNHIRLIEALSLAHKSGYKIKIILSGPDSGELKNIKASIEKYNLDDYVKFLGFLPVDELKAIYHLSYGLVMPSLFESVSLPVFEAMKIGKPVATSNICGMPDQLADLGIYFDPYNSENIKDAIIKLWSLPELEYKSLNEKLIARYNILLDKKEYAKKIIEIYRSVFNE
jgi:glycosyltransferase involved in cell wall biosynthesis